jgi:DHA1 family bicyclomycin/chloramphenicol resistance-like MFS transporter
MAAMSALDAFSIDAMLPALDQIGTDLELQTANSRQYVITALFLGFSIGVFFYGFVADWIGRRIPVLFGFAIFCVGSAACIFSQSYMVMLAGRVLQGVGAAGPYVLAIAIVRDSYKGEEMARTLSLIMMVFIGVPMIAPFVGQGFLLLFGWRSIFIALAVFALLTMLWFWLRQPETLDKADRTSLSAATFRHSITQVVTHPVTCRYLLIIGLLAGAFIAYLSTAQQIFQDMYGLGTRFPIVFASLAATLGVGSFINARLVEKFGAVTMVKAATGLIILSSVLYILVYHNLNELPPLKVHVIYNGIVAFCFAFLFGNTTSIAMEPMGHIAGAASSVLNSLSTIIAIIVATVIGSQLNQTGHPIVIGYLIAASVALLLVVTTRYHNTDSATP